MKIPRRITYSWLSAHKACDAQLRIFRAEWPDDADLTEANLLRAAALGLDLGWLAEKILPPPAWRAYEETRATTWRAYEETRATALRAFDEAIATALIAALAAEEEGK